MTDKKVPNSSEFRTKVKKEYRGVLERATQLGFTASWLTPERTAICLWAPDGSAPVRMPVGVGFQTDRPAMLIRRLERLGGDEVTEAEPEQELIGVVCDHCGAEFDSDAALVAHRRQVADWEAARGEAVNVVGGNEVMTRFVARWNELHRAQAGGASKTLCAEFGLSKDRLARMRQEAIALGHEMPAQKRGGSRYRTKQEVVLEVPPALQVTQALESVGEPGVEETVTRIARLLEDVITARTAALAAELEVAKQEAERFRGKWEALASLVRDEEDA